MTGTQAPVRRRGVDVHEILDRPDDQRDTPSAWITVLAPVPVLIAALALRPLVQGIAWWVGGVVAAARATR
ncbi:MAG: hypothetical protein V4737_04980, partial [Curtobacterium sp.]